MDTLLRFGAGTQLYTFDPTDQIQLRDNFRDVLARTSRLPGLSGGFDEFGTGIAPSEIGNVSIIFGYAATSNADMEAKKLDLGRMKTFGKKRLYKQSLNPAAAERYCEARVNSIDYTEKVGDRPETYLIFTVNFQVDNPFWLTQGTEAPQYGDGSTFGSGVSYGGAPIEQSLIGVDNSFSVTPNGNDISYPRFTLEVPSGKSASDIRIQRLVNNVIIDQIRYDAALSAGDFLEINTRAYNVFLNGADAYDDNFSFNTAAWFQLLGSTTNTIRVLMDNPTDEIDLKLRYFEAYNV